MDCRACQSRNVSMTFCDNDVSLLAKRDYAAAAAANDDIRSCSFSNAFVYLSMEVCMYVLYARLDVCMYASGYL